VCAAAVGKMYRDRREPYPPTRRAHMYVHTPRGVSVGSVPLRVWLQGVLWRRLVARAISALKLALRHGQERVASTP